MEICLIYGGIPLKLLRIFNEISQKFLWDTKEISLELYWNFFEITLKFLWNFSEIILQNFSEISLVFHWNFSGMPKKFQWNISGISLKFPRIIPDKFQRNSSVIPMKFLEGLPLPPFVAKKSLWIPILYTFFHVFPHVYICIYGPGAGADNPLWTKFWCQQKGLFTLPICCRFKKNIFEVWFYTYFCLFLYMYIALGQVRECPGVRILILT